MAPPKSAASSTIDPALIAEAKALGAYASFCDEAGLRARIARMRQAQRDAEPYREEIEAHNREIAHRPTFGDAWRAF